MNETFYTNDFYLCFKGKLSQDLWISYNVLHNFSHVSLIVEFASNILWTMRNFLSFKVLRATISKLHEHIEQLNDYIEQISAHILQIYNFAVVHD